MCEGSRDEYGYLRTARTAFRLPQANVVIRAGGGGSPAQIVRKAITLRDRHAARAEERFDATWVVLDAEHAATSGIGDAIATASRKGLQVALSNPCFEVWLLLHSGPQGAAMSARDARRRCREAFGITARARKRVAFDDPRLGATWETAAEHARHGREIVARDGAATGSSDRLVLARNPGCNVDELLVRMREARAGAA